MIGILPINQKFLPSFESDVEGQTMPNPLRGFYRPQPKERDYKRFVGPLDQTNKPQIASEGKLDMRRFLKRADASFLAQENVLLNEIKPTFGLGELDQIWDENGLIEYLKNYRGISLPTNYFSLFDLKFEAAHATITRMAKADLELFLRNLQVDISDCPTEQDLRVRARVYICSFEEYCRDKYGPFLKALL